jgi:hypothetical protein
MISKNSGIAAQLNVNVLFKAQNKFKKNPKCIKM